MWLCVGLPSHPFAYLEPNTTQIRGPTTQPHKAIRQVKREKEKNREQDPSVSLAISRSALHKMQRCPHTQRKTYVIPSEKQRHTEREKQKRKIKDETMKREKPRLKIKAG